MNRLPSIVFGIFLTFLFSWLGVAAYSYVKLGQLGPVVDDSTGDINPPQLSGLAVAGQRVYVANGCVSCHSQQIRPAAFSADVEWAKTQNNLAVRPTVARDYLRDKPALPGTLRIGPDLANLGLRSTEANWFHRHLYEPAEVTHGSVMPSFRYLYTLRKITGQPSNDALQGLTGPHAPQPGYEVVPTEDARILVAYLMSLKRTYSLPEAEPLP